MPEVLDYLEYREYLKDWFVETKKDNPFTSYRYLGQKTGVDPAWLVRVFQKEGHLNESTLPVFIRICGLDDRRAEYFKTLYRFNKTKAKQTLSELYYIIPVYFPFSFANSSSSAAISSLNTGFESNFKKFSKFTFTCFLKPCVFYTTVDFHLQLI